jgi:P pilus assembly chaperone PapD
MHAMKRNIGMLARGLAALLLAVSVPANAGVVMNATRYICRSTSGWNPARNRSA